MPRTVATILLNEFAETESRTPLGAIPKGFGVREDGQLIAFVEADANLPANVVTRLRVSGSLEPLSDKWRYVSSVVHGMGVYHLWMDYELFCEQANTVEEEENTDDTPGPTGSDDTGDDDTPAGAGETGNDD